MTRPRPIEYLLRIICGPTGQVAHDLNLATARTDDELITVMRRLGIDVTREGESAA